MRLLELQNISIAFDRGAEENVVVRDVSWHLDEGEILGIIGESGSGKTVSCLSIVQLLPPSARILQGTVFFKGKDLLQARDMRALRGKEIGYIFQESNPAFDPLYPIGKTMVETLRNLYTAESSDVLQDRAVHLLQEMHISHPERRLKNYPHQFSGGMLQRVMIALALAQDPCILIADEATTSLDVTIQAEIIQLLLELQKNRRLSIIFISHDISLVSGIADRMIVMESGFIREQEKTRKLIQNPGHPYTKMLLDHVITMEIINDAHST